MKSIIWHIRHLLLAIILMSLSNICVLAKGVQVRGVVLDSLTNMPVSYAAIALTSTPAGTMTNERGQFGIVSYAPDDSLRVSLLGYQPKTLKIKRSAPNNNLIIKLNQTGVRLSEVIVKPKKEKYSKKNNPAVAFMERIRKSETSTDPRRHDFYRYEKYERLTMAINEFKMEGGSWLDKNYKFLSKHIDTSEISGKPILNISLREKMSDVCYTKDPSSEHEYVSGLRQVGLDDVSSKDGIRMALEDVFREIDLYQNDVTLLQNRFVSPLSKIAADYYKFYLSDTVVVDSDSCVVLSFVPHTSQAWGFIGKLYVPKNDSTMFVKKVDLYLPHSINVNFIDGMVVSQTFKKCTDGTRLKVKDDMIMELSVLPGTPKLYVRRNTHYGNHSFEKFNIEDYGLYSDQYEIVSNEAYDIDENQWNQQRPVPLNRGEQGLGNMVSELRSDKFFYWTEKTLKLLFSGYVHTSKNSKFDYGPINTSISFNSVEGLRLRAGGMTTANLSKRWFARGFAAYGFKDHKWKYRAEIEYSFRDKKYHSREFPVHSLRFTSLYALDQLGQRYNSTNSDNFFHSFKRMEDTRVTYMRQQQLLYTLELTNNFSIEASVNFERQEATRWIPFIDGYGNRFNHYNEAAFELDLRYAPGEKFYQGKTGRRPINLDAPVFSLSHIYAPKGFLGSKFMINRTEFRYSQRYWLSAFGYIDAVFKAGHVWNSVPYMNLLLPNANITYVVRPESYSLMNPLEFINDSYASADLTYWMNGVIFNRIPVINKLKLREVVTFKALWGHRSQKNNPFRHPELFRFPDNVNVTDMGSVPYMEVSVGVDNILSLFRVDSVWRLSYRNTPDAPNWGILVGMHLAF
ncbi:DUF5686 and carboxypeptidase-like regulatory domain-containing protein [uncultured Muribaculum sp.]|uniref:DUF5686 and carboxypeptidase-like regulatory domain-containing protein n=4 Tax=Muribaculum TaxID=1918540 RepID=UPI0025B671B0|nr:DUF5686 and carboxypeptidase-like regulatory domain-containing protein [uncultured Muribaculum sp.]